MRGYPQFSFWISIALVKIYISCIIINRGKNTFELVGTVLKGCVRVKDKTENLKKCGTVYHIHCEQCDKNYVGETARLLETRIKEHLSRNSSAEHFKLTGHSVDSSKIKVLATENRVTHSNAA